MGGVGQVACLGFLVREAVLVFWWVELEFFCRFQSCSLCFSFFCVLASSVSNFHPDTRGRWWTLSTAHLFSRALGREEHCKQITLVCALSVSATLGLPLLTVCVLSLSTLLRL